MITKEQRQDIVDYLNRMVPDIARKTRTKNDEVIEVIKDIFSK